MDFKRTYRYLVRLYPKDFQYGFSTEMFETFDQAIDERRGLQVIPFVLREAWACMRGAYLEWIAKLTTDKSIRTRYLPDLRMMPLPWVSRESRRRSLRKFQCSSDTSR